jgi:hypothetical protein
MRVRELCGGRERAGQLSDSDDHQALWLSILVDVDRHCLGKIERAAGDGMRHLPDHPGNQSRFWKSLDTADPDALAVADGGERRV